MLAVSVGYAVDPLRGSADMIANGLGRWCMIPMLVVWWVAAIRRYLRMPNAWVVVLTLGTLMFLVLLALVVVLAGDGVMDW